ncbi:MAG: DUF1566 domain-containing protein [Halieaceae bacterium]|jgi:hypothetical protein|nr:DUF1566 domain-containing protein [Halieaceae bacterium]
MAARRIVLVTLLSLLASCKLQIIVPIGGSIITASGTYTCLAGQTCEIDVVDLLFDETFTAVPDDGYRFDQWKKKQSGRGFCATVSARHSPCRLYTSFFGGWPNLFAFLATDEVFYLEPVFIRPFNDTGIIFGQNYLDGNNADCTGVTIEQQDCSHGRDATHKDDSDGHAGFSYTKLGSTGAALPASAASWSCVRDNVTGWVWEVKTDDGGNHDKDNTYRWGGKTALGAGVDTYYPDWDTLLDGSNAASFCGYSSWRLPTIKELEALANLNRYSPAIDMAFFPATPSAGFWSASPSANDSNSAWYVNFDWGNANDDDRGSYRHVRLVHSGQ